MRTAGLPMTDPWATHLLDEPTIVVNRYDQVDATLSVYVQSVILAHHQSTLNYRPYLHATGELRAIHPHSDLAGNISTITYQPGHGETVDMFYECDHDQLVALVAKGYFSRHFTLPDTITNIEWDIPAVVDISVITPDAAGVEAPIVFTHVHDIAALRIDTAISGYDLIDYCVDYSADMPVPTLDGDMDIVDDMARERYMAERDSISIAQPLFSDDELGLDDPVNHPAPTSGAWKPLAPVTPDDDQTRLASQPRNDEHTPTRDKPSVNLPDITTHTLSESRPTADTPSESSTTTDTPWDNRSMTNTSWENHSTDMSWENRPTINTPVESHPTVDTISMSHPTGTSWKNRSTTDTSVESRLTTDTSWESRSPTVVDSSPAWLTPDMSSDSVAARVQPDDMTDITRDTLPDTTLPEDDPIPYRPRRLLDEPVTTTTREHPTRFTYTSGLTTVTHDDTDFSL